MVGSTSEFLDSTGVGVKLRLILFLLLALAAVGLADPVPITIWQKEHRYQPEPGETLRLQRGKFTLVMPLQADGEALSLLSAAGPQPDSPLFQPGQGMAGPYDGLFLTWEGFHYFYLDPQEAEKYRRAELWDREQGL